MNQPESYLSLINPLFYSIYFVHLTQSLSDLFPLLVVTGATDGIGKAYAEEVRFPGLWTNLT